MPHHLYPLFPDLNEQEKINPIRNIVPVGKERNFGLELCKGALFSGKYGFPKLKPYMDEVPEQFIPFHNLFTSKDYSNGVWCFEYDNILERLWNNPNRYFYEMAKFKCVCEPDFSLKLGTPLGLQIGNCYRRHTIAYSMLDKGISMLPCPSWSDGRSLDFCFDGYSKGGAVAISTVGTLRDERSRFYFEYGFKKMLAILSPDVVLMYGDVDDRIRSLMPIQLDVRYFENPNFSRMRNYGRKGCI